MWTRNFHHFQRDFNQLNMFVDLKFKIATFTMCNKKQPPEVFYKKLLAKISSSQLRFYKKVARKDFSIFVWKCLCWRLLLIKLQVFRSTILLKRDSNTCFSMNIAKFLKMSNLKKICERLLLNNVEPNSLSIYLKTAK